MPMPKPISIGTLAIANHTFEEELRKNPAAFRAGVSGESASSRCQGPYPACHPCAVEAGL